MYKAKISGNIFMTFGERKARKEAFKQLREVNDSTPLGSLLVVDSNIQTDEWKLVAHADANGKLGVLNVKDNIFVNPEYTHINEFRVRPLCWVENRPVYAGDVLYSKTINGFRYDAKEMHDGMLVTAKNETGADQDYPENLTWAAPEKTIKAFMNCYPDPRDNAIHLTREGAESSKGNACFKCVEIEWKQ